MDGRVRYLRSSYKTDIDFWSSWKGEKNMPAARLALRRSQNLQARLKAPGISSDKHFNDPPREGEPTSSSHHRTVHDFNKFAGPRKMIDGIVDENDSQDSNEIPAQESNVPNPMKKFKSTSNSGLKSSTPGSSKDHYDEKEKDIGPHLPYIRLHYDDNHNRPVSNPLNPSMVDDMETHDRGQHPDTQTGNWGLPHVVLNDQSKLESLQLESRVGEQTLPYITQPAVCFWNNGTKDNTQNITKSDHKEQQRQRAILNTDKHETMEYEDILKENSRAESNDTSRVQSRSDTETADSTSAAPSPSMTTVQTEASGKDKEKKKKKQNKSDKKDSDSPSESQPVTTGQTDDMSKKSKEKKKKKKDKSDKKTVSPSEPTTEVPEQAEDKSDRKTTSPTEPVKEVPQKAKKKTKPKVKSLKEDPALVGSVAMEASQSVHKDKTRDKTDKKPSAMPHSSQNKSTSSSTDPKQPKKARGSRGSHTPVELKPMSKEEMVDTLMMCFITNQI